MLVSHLADLTRLFAAYGIGYGVDELATSWDGTPATTVV